jgi:N-acyl homoserine lactone hydrolase
MTRWQLDVVDVATIPALPLSGFVAGAADDELIDVPCLAFLLTAENAAVLVDTGPDPVRAAAAGFRVDGNPRQALLSALARRGRRPADVDFIIHTHLHYDHMQNDGVFPRAAVVVQEREARWAAGPAADVFCAGVADFRSALGGRLRLVDGDLELLPGLRLVLTAGHTPGHQAVLADTGGRTWCIAGDLVPLGANIERPPPSCPDPAAAAAFLDRASREHWLIAAGHDPCLRGAQPWPGRGSEPLTVTVSTCNHTRHDATGR